MVKYWCLFATNQQRTESQWLFWRQEICRKWISRDYQVILWFFEVLKFQGVKQWTTYIVDCHDILFFRSLCQNLPAVQWSENSEEENSCQKTNIESSIQRIFCLWITAFGRRVEKYQLGIHVAWLGSSDEKWGKFWLVIPFL